MHDRHDKLFRSTFAQREHAADLVRAALPPAVVAHLDLGSLTMESTGFIDQALGERRADLLYRTTLAGHDAYIYVLIEHQSGEDALMPFRFVRYMVAIWNQYLLDTPKATTLPVILPLLVYQGSERGPWRAPRRMSELFALPAELREALGRHCLDVELVLDDLGAMSNAHLRARAMNALSTLVLWALARTRYSMDILAELDSNMDLMAAVWQSPNGKEALTVVLRYISRTVQARNPDAAREILTMPLLFEVDDEYDPSLYYVDMIDFMCRERGREEGRRAGQLELVRKQLELRFSTLPPEVLEYLEQAGLDALEAIAIRLLSVATLGDALGQPRE